MDTLVFQLQAPLAAWGEPAVGEYRGSADHPGESALLGLLAAALGVVRDDEPALQALQAGYRFAVGIQSTGTLLRDYHTAQVPGRSTLKGRPHATRADELAVPRHELNTILSTRDYRQGASCLVAVQARPDPPHSLNELAGALRAPRFVLYLGRKACPLAAPMYPQVVTGESVLNAFEPAILPITLPAISPIGPRAAAPTIMPMVDPMVDPPAAAKRCVLLPT